ncbi:MAG TPA: hypothetical protein VF074_11355, partial [Pyrinomonadaceae bacterium]
MIVDSDERSSLIDSSVRKVVGFRKYRAAESYQWVAGSILAGLITTTRLLALRIASTDYYPFRSIDSISTKQPSERSLAVDVFLHIGNRVLTVGTTETFVVEALDGIVPVCCAFTLAGTTYRSERNA